MYVLRKSFGPYSAGTRVDLMGEAFYCGDLPVPTELVVERRPKTTTRPFATTSRERRATKRATRKAVLNAGE